MLIEIKNKIENEIRGYIALTDNVYRLRRISPLLLKCIKEFITRKGKRVRPILFVIGYMGFSGKEAPGLYRSALSMELLHDFMLVHDDIIDKSDTRRGRPSMHKMLNDYLRGWRKRKFSGEDLGIVIGDVIYALGLNAFLEIKEDGKRKEAALKKLIEAALFTGSGEFIELLYGLKDIKDITREDIYKVYDYKTACYTFAAPLTIGATLAGADQSQIDKLFRYGICLGRAFQIKDDIHGMFSEEKETGKSSLTDLQEAKKTILIWYAYNHSNSKNKARMKNIMLKSNISLADLHKMREIIAMSQALDFAGREIEQLIKKARALINSSGLIPRYRDLLSSYSKEMLS